MSLSGTGDFGNCSPYSKCGANLPIGGGLWTNAWNIAILKFIYTIFGNSPTGQTRRWIFALDGSNDTDTCKGVPFGGIIDITTT